MLRRIPKSFEVATPYGFNFAGNTAQVIPRYVYLFGVWQPDITAWVWNHLRPGDIALDLGANLGYLSLLAATRTGPTGRVLAVEAEPEVFKMLQRNLQLNPELSVVARQAIVGESAGIGTIYRADSDHGSSSTERSGVADGVGTQVRMIRADSLVSTEDLPRLRLVKLDVEGDELRVLRGLDSLLHLMPVGSAVLAEIDPEMLAVRGHTADEILQFMVQRDFEPMVIPNDYSPVRYVSTEVIPPNPLKATPRKAVDVAFIKASRPESSTAGSP